MTRRTGVDRAVAVSFRSGQRAPIVEAHGDAGIARKMEQTARRFGIPVHHDKKLAHALSALPPQSEIPCELFEPLAAAMIAAKRRR